MLQSLYCFRMSDSLHIISQSWEEFGHDRKREEWFRLSWFHRFENGVDIEVEHQNKGGRTLKAAL